MSTTSDRLTPEQKILKTFVDTVGWETIEKLFFPKAYSICPHCRRHIVLDRENYRMVHKRGPKFDEACLVLRGIWEGPLP